MDEIRLEMRPGYAPGKTLVLLDKIFKGKPTGPGRATYTCRVTTGIGVVLYLSAFGGATYNLGDSKNAGVLLQLLENQTLRSHADSFEGESSNIDFHACANYVLFLPAGQTRTFTADTKPWGTQAHLNVNPYVSLKILALAAEKYDG